MKNLNRWEIANHIHTSVKESYPVGGERIQPSVSGRNIPTNGEYASHSPETNLRDDRSFTQSLWGRR